METSPRWSTNTKFIVMLAVLVAQQLSGVLATVRTFIDSIPVWIETLSAEPIVIGPFTFDLSTADITMLQDTLLSTARDWVGQITEWMTSAATDVVSFIGWTGVSF